MRSTAREGAYFSLPNARAAATATKRHLQSEQRRQGKGLGHLPLVGHDGMPRADQKQ
jgi:hypothetical protein